MVLVPVNPGGASNKPQLDVRINVVAVLLLIVFILASVISAAATDKPLFLLLILVGVILSMSPKVAKQWEKGVVLRLGRFVGLRGPGLFWIVPLLDSVSTWIDQRVITTSFAAEQTLTSDTVPVNVD